ncbi:winged helix-turn-helix domain-containing protein [Myxococcota bacterium]|nr:winged helix-turn-helix domain-containing protein [Polyangiaceae bacterium]MCK6552198.1 winged helix-turn-helix domain-containing protein [Myxococcota bacterium]
MATKNLDQLEAQIEQLIREHISECRRRAAAAVERSFASAAKKSGQAERPGRVARVTSRRRPADELEGLGARLYAAMCANPGAPMAAYAPVVGASTRELHRPAKLLKRSGRVRSVGERNATRYFPIPARSKSAG